MMGFEVRREWMVTSLSRFAEAGRDGMSRLLAAQERPTAVIGAYSYITQGILAELNAQGLGVPRDFSVVSMDSDPSPLDPRLDVACIPSGIEEICDVALRLLRERMHTDNPNTPRQIVLDSNFHTGESVRSLRSDPPSDREEQ